MVLEARCTVCMAKDHLERARQQQRQLEDELAQEHEANRECEDRAFLVVAREAVDLVSVKIILLWITLIFEIHQHCQFAYIEAPIGTHKCSQSIQCIYVLL